MHRGTALSVPMAVRASPLYIADGPFHADTVVFFSVSLATVHRAAARGCHHYLRP